MDSINGVLGILISTVKLGFVIFLITQIQSGLKANVHFNRGAKRQFCSDHSLPNVDSCGHCARSF